jgi:hypothetical protein
MDWDQIFSEACETGDLATVKKLSKVVTKRALKEGLWISAQNYEGNAPEDQEDQFEIIKYLVEKKKINVKEFDDGLISGIDSIKIGRYLIEKGLKCSSAYLLGFFHFI